VITSPVFDPGVEEIWEIGPGLFRHAETTIVPNNMPGKKPMVRYAAPSTSVLLLEKKQKIEIVAGRAISDETIQNVMGYAMKQNKFLEVRSCEKLDNLRAVDRMVVLCNEFIHNSQPRLDEISLDDSENYED